MLHFPAKHPFCRLHFFNIAMFGKVFCQGNVCKMKQLSRLKAAAAMQSASFLIFRVLNTWKNWYFFVFEQTNCPFFQPHND